MGVGMLQNATGSIDEQPSIFPFSLQSNGQKMENANVNVNMKTLLLLFFFK
jgi:hypothetical protein